MKPEITLLAVAAVMCLLGLAVVLSGETEAQKQQRFMADCASANFNMQQCALLYARSK